MKTNQETKIIKDVKITFSELEMSAETLVNFLEVLKKTELETYLQLKKQLKNELENHFKENEIDNAL